MGDIKLIVTDLDGTFLGERNDIPEQNIRAVEAAKQAGIIVCPCSARLWGMGRYLSRKGGFDRWGAFNNGAAIADAQTGEIAHRIGIAPEFFKRLIEETISFGAVVQSWNHDFIGIYGPTMGERGRRMEQGMNDPNGDFYCKTVVYDTVEAMDEECRDIAQKILLIMDDNQVPMVIEKLSTICGVEVSSSNDMIVEVTMPEATKGNGAKRLAQMYGIDAKNVMAIGDNHNDVGMLEFAGVKVAVDNAKDSVKSVAQHVVASNLDGGFAQAVFEIALNA